MGEETQRYFIGYMYVDCDDKIMNEEKAVRFAAALEEVKNSVANVKGEAFFFAVADAKAFKKALAETKKENGL